MQRSTHEAQMLKHYVEAVAVNLQACRDMASAMKRLGNLSISPAGLWRTTLGTAHSAKTGGLAGVNVC